MVTSIKSTKAAPTAMVDTPSFDFGAFALDCAKEFSGIADIERAYAAYKRGDNLQALLYGGMAAMIIIPGVGAIGKYLAEGMVRDASKVLFKDLSDQIVKEASKRISSSTLETAGREAAELGFKNLSGIIMKEGASEAALRAVEKEMAKIGAGTTRELLCKSGMDKFITEATLKHLQKLHAMPVKEVEAILCAAGVQRSEVTAKVFKWALDNGYFKKQMRQEAAAIITNDLLVNFEARGLKKGFQETWSALLKGVDNLTAEEIVKLEQAGYLGFRKGARKGIYEVVDEALKEAFKRFKPNRKRKNPLLVHESERRSADIKPETWEDVRQVARRALPAAAVHVLAEARLPRTRTGVSRELAAARMGASTSDDLGSIFVADRVDGTRYEHANLGAHSALINNGGDAARVVDPNAPAASDHATSAGQPLQLARFKQATAMEGAKPKQTTVDVEPEVVTRRMVERFVK